MVFQSELIPLQSWSIKLTEFAPLLGMLKASKACESVKNLMQFNATNITTVIPPNNTTPNFGTSPQNWGQSF